jgi:hypothetical protein
MKISIAIEVIDGTLEAAAAPDDRRDERCHFSANFVAQLAATLLQSPAYRCRGPVEPHGAVQCYESASAPFVCGTATSRKA